MHVARAVVHDAEVASPDGSQVVAIYSAGAAVVAGSVVVGVADLGDVR